ncbi:carbon-nitrogen hydrolase family protein [Candidimonas nitroreducens]|uniref:Nitrilase n=1 Tax=Candidimonas nitroreducens TaxID=683354 RepID=A0A225M6H6_9BURK|nr:carbon-nitrogen hydrolase family protein [Candidimonas nitroreducens]OWT56878.1 nitrilase [Candidimonas nitroreducens]
MTSSFQASLIQFSPRLLEPEHNLSAMSALAASEARSGSRLIVFPELSNTGYVDPISPGLPYGARIDNDRGYALQLYEAAEPAQGGPGIRMLCDIARRHDAYLVAGLALRHPKLAGVMHNSSVLVGPEGVVGIYHKMHRWHMEKLYFVPGDSISTWQTGLGCIGMQICYDIRFPEITRIMALQGAEIITSAWASATPEDTPLADPDLFLHRAYTRAVENGVFFLSCNRAGDQGSFHFLGRSLIVAPDGKVLAKSGTDGEDLVRADLDLSAVARYRASTGIFTDRREDIYRRYV